jgi:hypothetical protein
MRSVICGVTIRIADGQLSAAQFGNPGQCLPEPFGLNELGNLLRGD